MSHNQQSTIPTLSIKIMRLFLAFCFSFISCSAIADTQFIDRPEVQTFINQMVKKNHFKKTELTTLFESVKVRPKIIRSIKAPLEKTSWYTYQRAFVTEWRIREGVKFWNKYQEALERAERTYGVPASIIVATIGIETKYGRYTGEYPVIDALVNLAFGDTSRAPFFRNELEQFLLLTREQHLDPYKVTGSYAGAIGQPQFMPSSYRYYAVNFSNSGKIDLSHNEIDVIGSIANYYQKHGWQANQSAVMPASIQGGKYQFSLGGARTITKSELTGGGMISTRLGKQKFKVIELQNYYGSEYWLGFHNFDVIKRYNASDLYAMAVCQLSYYITELREKSYHG